MILYKICMRLFLGIVVGVKYFNQHVLKREKNFIIVSNHNSHLDTMALMAALPIFWLNKTKPVAAGDYFGDTPLKEKLSKYFLNALLIPRTKDENKEEEHPIDKMLHALDEGNSLILFPEGSRGEAEKMQTFKKGVGVLLKKRKNIPYIPVYMCGFGKAMPKGRLLLVPHECAIYFGEPTYASSDNVDEIVLEIESNVLRLAKTYHEKVENNELGE